MSKRTTEAVLRDEVARAEKDLATAKRKVELASAASDAAAAKHAEQKNAADVAAGALLRARQALSAFTGSPVTTGVDLPAEEAASTPIGS